MTDTRDENNLFDEDDGAIKEKNEADLKAVNKIETIYLELKYLDYYDILNVSRNASADEIKRSYYKMAREFHPDRYLHLNSDSLKEKLNVIFSYINEAYRGLTSSSHAPQAEIKPGFERDEDQKRKIAGQKFEEGKRYFDKHYFEQALTFLGQAVYLDGSRPDYHYYYGLSLSHNQKIREAEASLRKAVQLDPYNSDYITELGYIYLHLDFKIRAGNTFKKALKYNPLNQRASEGLKNCLP